VIKERDKDIIMVRYFISTGDNNGKILNINKEILRVRYLTLTGR
jgi:hypothetical protein